MPMIQISIMPDLMPIDEYDDNSCPLATRDEEVDANNKETAVDEANYGEAVGTSDVCGNCKAYDQTAEMMACIGDDSGDFGYCRMYRFVCAATRTCDSWVEGGPITSENQQTYRDNL